MKELWEVLIKPRNKKERMKKEGKKEGRERTEGKKGEKRNVFWESLNAVLCAFYTMLW